MLKKRMKIYKGKREKVTEDVGEETMEGKRVAGQVLRTSWRVIRGK